MKAKKIKSMLLIFVSLSFSCSSQTQKTKAFILEFEKEFYKDKKTNIKSLIKYLDIHPDVEKSNSLKEIIDNHNEVAKARKKLDKDLVFNIKIISYEEASKVTHYRDEYSFKKLDYKNKKNVYYAVYPLNEHEIIDGEKYKDKIVGPIIVNDQGKIISFYSYFRTGADPVVPFMLNKKPTIDWLGQPFK